MFFDELDTIGFSRSKTTSDNNRSVIDQLLNELDGVNNNNKNILILAATNTPWDIDSALKRYQITTESISTIFNSRRPFTRVFYAKNEEDAHEMLVKWFADRQLHENKAKTVITELKADGSSVYEVK